MRWVVGAVVGALVAALVAVSAVAVVRGRQLATSNERAEALEARISELEAAPSPTPSATASTDPFAGLFDGDGLEGLLDGLTGEGLDVPGAECLVPEGGLDELLGGGGLDSLLDGDRSAGPTAADPDAVVDQVADEVAEARELTFTSEVDVELVSGAEIAERVGELFLDDYDERTADTERRLLAALGVLEPDTDLRMLRRDLLGEQVAGYYVPETGDLVVRRPEGEDGTALGALDRITLAHELNHALTDQALEFPEEELADTADADGAQAALAVTEGDATLLMQGWALANVSLADQLAMLADPAATAAQESLDEAPHYLARELLFPYTAGLGFVCDVHQDGGWAAVDALYDDLPSATAQILDPQLYRDGQQPADPPALTAPNGWTSRLTTTFGAASLQWLFEAPGDDTAAALDAADERAAAWAGGEVSVWVDGDDTAVGIGLVDGAEGGQLCASVTDWYAAASPDATAMRTGGADTVLRGERQAAAIACDHADVRVGLAPTPEIATTIVGR